MNRKLEDKLAMLAFGDMTPEETARLEQELAGDREAMQVLEDYRGMRADLRMLADMPEHQLSTERLRHAILNQGLKPKSRPQFGWLWMPTVAACLAFGVVMLRNARTQAIAPDMAVASLGAEKQLPELAGAPKLENAFAFATASGQILSVARPVAAPVAMHQRHRSDNRRIEALKEAVQAEFDNQLVVNNIPAASAPSNQPYGAPIILIDGSQDSSTGAMKATEVDSASNVVVGG